MPKLKGFSNAKFKKHFTIINLSDVELAAKAGLKEVSKQTLLEANMISNKNLPVKLLGKGELKAKVTVVVEAASSSAVSAIEAAG